MTKVALLFSNVPRILWDEAWLNAGAVKRHLPSAANEGFKSPLHMIKKVASWRLQSPVGD